MVPNTGPTLENVVFDPTLYGLTVVIVIASLAAAFIALRNRVVAPRRALGTGLVALGYSAIVTVVILLLVLFRMGSLGGFLYLQAEFAAAYAGCLSVMYGLDRVIFDREPAPRVKRIQAVLWAALVVSIGVATAYLLDPLTYTVTTVGGTQHVSQESVFWLPPFVTLVVGMVGLPVAIVRMGRRDSRARNQLAWVALFFGLCIAGVTKESKFIPSLGDPLLDMLAAFLPFTAGSVCLLKSAFGLRRLEV